MLADSNGRKNKYDPHLDRDLNHRSYQNPYTLGDSLPTNWKNLEGQKLLTDNWMTLAEKNRLVATDDTYP